MATQQRERLRLRLRLRQRVLVVPSCLSWALPDFLPTMVAVAARLQRDCSALTLGERPCYCYRASGSLNGSGSGSLRLRLRCLLSRRESELSSIDGGFFVSERVARWGARWRSQNRASMSRRWRAIKGAAGGTLGTATTAPCFCWSRCGCDFPLLAPDHGCQPCPCLADHHHHHPPPST